MSAEACLVCRSTATRVWRAQVEDYFTGASFEIRRCRTCGLGWTDPQPAELSAHYPASYRRYRGLVGRALRGLYGRRIRRLVNELGASGDALEVGCGDGWMLRVLQRYGWRVAGIERAWASAAIAHQRGLPIAVGSLESTLAEPQFDLVILFHVLEHLNDPVGALRQCARRLKRGGRLLVAVPNWGGWQARLFGTHWLHLDVPRHLFHFSPHALTRALGLAGFEIARVGHVSLEHDTFGWLQSALNALGFPHNQLTAWCMGIERPALASLRGIRMILVAGALVIPSLLCTAASWVIRSGATLEVQARKRERWAAQQRT